MVSDRNKIYFPSVQLLTKCIALTSWRQSKDTNGVNTVIYVHKQNGQKYYQVMFDIANNLFIHHQSYARRNELLTQHLKSSIRYDRLLEVY